MENRFYQLCKANAYRGTIEANIPLLSRNSIGVRFTLRKGSARAQMKVPDEVFIHGDKKVFECIFKELEYQLQKALSTKEKPEVLCSACVRGYRKAGE